MSKIKDLPSRTGDQKTKDFLDELNEHNSVALPASMEGISDEDAFELMEKADSSKLKKLTGDYWKPSPGVHVFKFMDMTTVEFDGQEQEAVVLLDKSGTTWVAGQAVLVNSLKKVTELPCFCKIIVDGGMVKGKNGSYYPMQVLTFPSSANTKL
jgi:hypothetical protein